MCNVCVLSCLLFVFLLFGIRRGVLCVVRCLWWFVICGPLSNCCALLFVVP